MGCSDNRMFSKIKGNLMLRGNKSYPYWRSFITYFPVRSLNQTTAIEQRQGSVSILLDANKKVPAEHYSTGTCFLSIGSATTVYGTFLLVLLPVHFSIHLLIELLSPIGTWMAMAPVVILAAPGSPVLMSATDSGKQDLRQN